MKTVYKNMFRLSGVLSTAFWLLGCHAGAEQTSIEKEATEAIAVAAVQPDTVLGAAPESESASSTNPLVVTTSTNVTAGSNTVATASSTSTNADPQLSIVAAIPPAPPANVKLSKGTEEIIKLAQSDVSDTVILLYVEKATDRFDLDANSIVYLNDIGISSDVVAAMLKHDGQETDVQHVVEINNKNAATAAIPPPSTTPPPATTAAQPALEVSSNYVADPNAPQQPVTVQQPVIVQQPGVVQEPAVAYTAPAVTYSYFYSSLSPYGYWVEVPEYGWCWQPTIAL